MTCVTSENFCDQLGIHQFHAELVTPARRVFHCEPMSCLLVFINDIFSATPHKASNLDSDVGLLFVLELNDSPSVEFQNVRYMEFHAGVWSIKVGN